MITKTGRPIIGGSPETLVSALERGEPLGCRHTASGSVEVRIRMSGRFVGGFDATGIDPESLPDEGLAARVRALVDSRAHLRPIVLR